MHTPAFHNAHILIYGLALTVESEFVVLFIIDATAYVTPPVVDSDDNKSSDGLYDGSDVTSSETSMILGLTVLSDGSVDAVTAAVAAAAVVAVEAAATRSSFLDKSSSTAA